MYSTTSPGLLGISEGDVLVGKYRVERVLGAGGMGMVVAAHHLQLDERVAIKMLLPHTLDNPEAVERFSREARAAVKIKSEHVARMIDVGTMPNGAPYLVMEYLEGEDLSQWLAGRGALPIEQAVEFVLQACEALAEAHALGIVHRDLKPANLYCIRRADGLLSVKVLDFGISKVTSMSGSGPDMGMTKTASIMGSPLYMSPEQMHSARSVDARADIWAMGAILYELLARTTPFVGETFPELVLRVAGEEPQPLKSFRPDVPPGLEQVILRCLVKDRTRRYQNVADLARDLIEFAPRRSRSSVERISRVLTAAGLSASALALPPSSGVESERKQSGTVAPWGRTASSEARSSRAGIYAAVAGVAIIAAGAGAFINLRAATQPTGAASVVSVPVVATEADSPPRPLPPVIETASAAPVVIEPAPTLGATASKSSAAPVRPAKPGALRDIKPVVRPTAARTASPSRPTSAAQAAPKPSVTKPPHDLGGRL